MNYGPAFSREIVKNDLQDFFLLTLILQHVLFGDKGGLLFYGILVCFWAFSNFFPATVGTGTVECHFLIFLAHGRTFHEMP